MVYLSCCVIINFRRETSALKPSVFLDKGDVFRSKTWGGEISGSGLASLSLCDPWQKNKDRKKRAKRGKKKTGF